MIKRALLLSLLTLPALAQAPSGAGNVPRPAVPVAPLPAPAAKPAPAATGLLPLAVTRARLEGALGRPVTKPQWDGLTRAWKEAMAEARIAQNAYADRLAGITQLYRGRITELMPPIEQVGSFDGVSLFPKLEKERGLPLTREEKLAIADADKARRAQVLPITVRLAEGYASALGLPLDKVKLALSSAAPAASAPPSAPPPAKN